MGALIEWFYNYPFTPNERFLLGGNIFGRFFTDFDFHRGKQHNLKTLITYIYSVTGRHLIDPNDWKHHWAKVFLFDAVIGNTDRHQDNWGIVISDDGYNFSPAYDNGSSLGREYLPDRLCDDLIERHVRNGRHHIKWRHNEEKGIPHFELVHEFVNRFPDTRETVLQCIDFDFSLFSSALERLQKFRVPYSLENDRAKFIEKLVSRRIDTVKESLG